MTIFELEGIDHVAITVRDVAASVNWYREVLGLERRHQEAWGDHPAVMGIGTTSLALFPVGTDSPQAPPGRGVLSMRHIAFRANAANFVLARDALAVRGIAVQFQDHQIAQSIYFEDPDGHQIEITTYEL